MANKDNENRNGNEQNNGKWDELIDIMNELSEYHAHFVILLAKLYLDMERNGR